MEWYYLRDGKTMGPVSEVSIRAWLESGFLLPDDLLWRAGMAQWLPVVELPEFGGSGGDGRAAGLEEGREAVDSHPEGSSPEASEGPDLASAGPSGIGPSSASGQAVGGPASEHGRGRAGPGPWGVPASGWSAVPEVYANLWARAGAAAIDLMLLVAAVLLVFRPELPTSGTIEDMAKLNPAITPVFMALAWLYFGLLEGSALQASLGKLAFGLKVTDLEGNRLLLGRSMMRGLLKVVFMEITAFLSFLPAAFTARRQALHDIVAGSTVLVR